VQLVEDKAFKKQMDIMLRGIYNRNWKLFQYHVVEYKDFVQEMWCRLFEEKTYNGDVKLSMVSIKHNSRDYIRDMRRRLQIAQFQPYEPMAYYAMEGI
jgi:hypothetical protein